MLILGVDPGIARLGWGIISEDKNVMRVVDYGCFETPADQQEAGRLKEIYHFLTQLIAAHKPEVLSVEALFFAANTRTALTVGQARGIVLLAAVLSNLSIYSYTPLQVKQALSGYGRADKHQIQLMVKALLHLPAVPASDDAADALAIAITHAFSYKLQKKSQFAANP